MTTFINFQKIALVIFFFSTIIPGIYQSGLDKYDREEILKHERQFKRFRDDPSHVTSDFYRLVYSAIQQFERCNVKYSAEERFNSLLFDAKLDHVIDILAELNLVPTNLQNPILDNGMAENDYRNKFKIYKNRELNSDDFTCTKLEQFLGATFDEIPNDDQNVYLQCLRVLYEFIFAKFVSKVGYFRIENPISNQILKRADAELHSYDKPKHFVNKVGYNHGGIQDPILDQILKRADAELYSSDKPKHSNWISNWIKYGFYSTVIGAILGTGAVASYFVWPSNGSTTVNEEAFMKIVFTTAQPHRESNIIVALGIMLVCLIALFVYYRYFRTRENA